MMGTFRYMAPEQFYGNSSDVLTDIFSVGVIAYELLTWTHPFHSPEAAALMRNIMLLEPAPLRSLNPECPEALERIVAKLLSKDRDQRYQSLDDARFDLEPVMLELGKARTSELLSEAKKRVAAEELEPAQTLVREILELEPTHREAREMRETLQQQIQKKGLHVKVGALVGSGKQELAARHYPAAIQNFEAAVHLDRTNPELQKLLADARTRMENGLTAIRLLGAAREQVSRQDFAAARGVLSDALRHDPENRDVADLLETVDGELARLERELVIEEALQVARNFVWIQAYDDALATLAKLGGETHSPQVR
jgi:tetratricopeptide (TPR) repeat protein